MSSTEMPPTNTIIIEADITSSTTKKSIQQINCHLRHRILTTCGDANAMFGTKHIDPALCLYVGAIVMCIDNKHLKDKVPRGNGTICQALKIGLKQDTPSYKWRNYYGRKVWTVDATDVEYVECEHVNKTGIMIQLETQITELKRQLDLPQNDHQSEQERIKWLQQALIRKRIQDQANAQGASSQQQEEPVPGSSRGPTEGSGGNPITVIMMNEMMRHERDNSQFANPENSLISIRSC